MLKLNLQFFGGRGSSGDLGNDGGNEKGAKEEIPITRAMKDAETPERQKGLEGFVEAIEDANDNDFPGIGQMLETMAVGKKMNPTTLAYYKVGGGGIVINNGALKNADARYDACGDYHPPRGNKSGSFAIISHETGHAVSDAAAAKVGKALDPYCRDIVRRSATQLKYKNVYDFARKISGYAEKSWAECVAEAYADVRCNGSKAKAESQAIYARLVKDYNKK